MNWARMLTLLSERILAVSKKPNPVPTPVLVSIMIGTSTSSSTGARELSLSRGNTIGGGGQNVTAYSQEVRNLRIVDMSLLEWHTSDIMEFISVYCL
jgi:hypothetical protein